MADVAKKMYWFWYRGLHNYWYYNLRGCVLAKNKEEARKIVEQRYEDLIQRDKKHTITIKRVNDVFCEVVYD